MLVEYDDAEIEPHEAAKRWAGEAIFEPGVYGVTWWDEKASVNLEDGATGHRIWKETIGG